MGLTQIQSDNVDLPYYNEILDLKKKISKFADFIKDENIVVDDGYQQQLYDLLPAIISKDNDKVISHKGWRYFSHSYCVRYMLLAYGFLRDKKYKLIENKCDIYNKPHAFLIYSIVRSYTSDFSYNQIVDWLEEERL